MELLLIVNLSDKLNFEKWAEVYDGDAEKRATFMSNSIYGKVNDKQAMVKFTVTDQAKMEEHMKSSAPMFEELGITHEVYTVSPAQ
ncbi:MAG: hypothetical protein CME61_02390 [Halobacteriovoraceae bacterium]|nr:hypothetical protein [Halobacteriovoraceae bacterium]